VSNKPLSFGFLAPPTSGPICCLSENARVLASALADFFYRVKGSFSTAQNLCTRGHDIKAQGLIKNNNL